MGLVKIFFGYILAINLIGFACMGIDKRRAVKGRWRISESALLFTGLVGGCFGTYAGMLLFRHKTKKWKFKLLVPLECVLWVVLLIRGLFLAPLGFL